MSSRRLKLRVKLPERATVEMRLASRTLILSADGWISELLPSGLHDLTVAQ